MAATSILAPDVGLVLAHARTYELLAEAAVERMRAQAAREPRPNRILAAARALWQDITGAAPSTSTVLPRLEHYPYRS